MLEELWERGGGQGAGQSSVSQILARATPASWRDTDDHLQPVRQVVYLFNRETFFSEPEHWASQLREEVVLPPSLDCES